jgi:Ni,Fe-hydrogenase III large subunit
MYNHASDMGGIAVDVGFSFAGSLAALIKERFLRLNEKVSGGRYLKGLNIPGGLARDMERGDLGLINSEIAEIMKDYSDLKDILLKNGSFMDRVEGAGILKRKTAEDLGVTGLAGRASGIARDLRKDFEAVYREMKFSAAKQESGDALARLKVRMQEFEESARLISEFIGKLEEGPVLAGKKDGMKPGFALGCAEAWRGPVLYWLALDGNGAVERCKITDPSVRNWQGLAFAVPGNIIPDFPLCNKSFDLSYSGNDL